LAHIRPFRNDDIPHLADLWNHGMPRGPAIVPVEAHELDAVLFSRIDFRRADLLVAESPDGRLAGFAHVGLGPVDPAGPSHLLDPGLGSLLLLVVDPTPDADQVADALVAAAVGRLRDLGSKVLYAGGMYPLNPFYWGLYGGSEFAGIPDDHPDFQAAVARAGFQPVATTEHFDYPLADLPPPPPDPRLIVLRRQTRLEVVDDTLLLRWWDALAIGSSRPSLYRLVDRQGTELARATTWEMLGFERVDGLARVGLLDVVVPTPFRRKGHAKLLLLELLRHLKSQHVEAVSVQTGAENLPALALYRSLGFQPAGRSRLYRLPGANLA
jgi:ribosomal protein S18 acetylase RimI-like enzyme